MCWHFLSIIINFYCEKITTIFLNSPHTYVPTQKYPLHRIPWQPFIDPNHHGNRLQRYIFLTDQFPLCLVRLHVCFNSFFIWGRWKPAKPEQPGDANCCPTSYSVTAELMQLV